jgi:hypothetical protein
MTRGFGRIPFLMRRSSPGATPGTEPAPIRRPSDPDTVPVGPPVLLPTSNVRQVLFDAHEIPPVWARPRLAPEPAAPAEPVAAASAPVIEQRARKARTRRAPAGGSVSAGDVEATPRRTRGAGRTRKQDG